MVMFYHNYMNLKQIQNIAFMFAYTKDLADKGRP